MQEILQLTCPCRSSFSGLDVIVDNAQTSDEESEAWTRTLSTMRSIQCLYIYFEQPPVQGYQHELLAWRSTTVCQPPYLSSVLRAWLAMLQTLVLGTKEADPFQLQYTVRLEYSPTSGVPLHGIAIFARERVFWQTLECCEQKWQIPSNCSM